MQAGCEGEIFNTVGSGVKGGGTPGKSLMWRKRWHLDSNLNSAQQLGIYMLASS